MTVFESDVTNTSNSSSFTIHTWDTVSWGNPHTHTHIVTLANPIRRVVSGSQAWASSDAH